MRRFILHKILPSALLLGMVFPLLAAAPQEYSDRQLKLIAQMTAPVSYTHLTLPTTERV